MSTYDPELFTTPPDPDLVCPICQCVLDNPVECQCRHVFCRLCIETWLDKHLTCPTCRESVFTFDLRPVLPILQNMLNRLTMICPNNINGCVEKLNLENFHKHTAVCPHEHAKCIYEQCDKKILRMELDHHTTVCEYRVITCDERCGLEVLAREAHMHDCVNALKEKLSGLEKKMADLQEKNKALELQLKVARDREDEARTRGDYEYFSEFTVESNSTSTRSPEDFDDLNAIFASSDTDADFAPGARTSPNSHSDSGMVGSNSRSNSVSPARGSAVSGLSRSSSDDDMHRGRWRRARRRRRRGVSTDSTDSDTSHSRSRDIVGASYYSFNDLVRRASRDGATTDGDASSRSSSRSLSRDRSGSPSASPFGTHPKRRRSYSSADSRARHHSGTPSPRRSRSRTRSPSASSNDSSPPGRLPTSSTSPGSASPSDTWNVTDQSPLHHSTPPSSVSVLELHDELSELEQDERRHRKRCSNFSSDSDNECRSPSKRRRRQESGGDVSASSHAASLSHSDHTSSDDHADTSLDSKAVSGSGDDADTTSESKTESSSSNDSDVTIESENSDAEASSTRDSHSGQSGADRDSERTSGSNGASNSDSARDKDADSDGDSDGWNTSENKTSSGDSRLGDAISSVDQSHSASDAQPDAAAGSSSPDGGGEDEDDRDWAPAGPESPDPSVSDDEVSNGYDYEVLVPVTVGQLLMEYNSAESDSSWQP